MVFGESGWRYAFFLIGVMSILVASMVPKSGSEKPFEPASVLEEFLSQNAIRFFVHTQRHSNSGTASVYSIPQN